MRWKLSHLGTFKILTCKGTLRLVLIRVYRLEIQQVMLVFSTQYCEMLPLFPSLCSNPPPSPLPCVNKYTVHTYTVCKRGNGVLGFRQINTCRKVPSQLNFFRWRHFAMPSMSLNFLCWLCFISSAAWGNQYNSSHGAFRCILQYCNT